MSKIIATLTVLSLFVSVAYSADSSQKGSFTSSLFNNSAATQVYGLNTTGQDATIWVAEDIPYNQIIFGPGSTNATLFAYGITTSSTGVVTIYVRKLNATIVGLGTDTVESSYISSDATITSSAGAGVVSNLAFAVGPGYLGILATGLDVASTGNSQVYLIVVTGGTTAAAKTITANTATIGATYTISGQSIFYDPGSTSFFYTFLAVYETTSGSTAAYTNTINAGGYNASASAIYFAASSYSLTIGAAYTVATSKLTNPIIGPDNFTSASNIYVVYKDTTTGVLTTYYSKTPKATTTTALGPAQTLIADSSTATNVTTYLPIGVWASNYTYGISLSIESVVSSGTPIYKIANFYNATTLADSGIDYSTTTYMAIGVYGFELNTGYALLGVYQTSTSGSYAITYASFYANATLNTTSNGLVTLASTLSGPFTIFEDANGAEWIGWTDYTTSSGTTVTAYGYLAKLQGQDFPAFANALKGIMAFVAFCLAAVFAF